MSFIVSAMDIFFLLLKYPYSQDAPKTREQFSNFPCYGSVLYFDENRYFNVKRQLEYKAKEQA